jgi:formylmethanofuran dehydrogenase subunit E
MLLGYQRMPVSELLLVQRVTLTTPIEQIVSRPRFRAICEHCGEEIMNEREIVGNGVIMCRACAGHAYYTLEKSQPVSSPESQPNLVTGD